MPDLFSSTCGDVLVLGVGQLGCTLAMMGAANSELLEGPLRPCWAAAHVDAPELIGTRLERKLLLEPNSACHGHGAVDDEALTRLLSGCPTVVLVSSLSEQIAATLPALVRQIQAQHRRAYVLVQDTAEKSTEIEQLSARLERETDLLLRIPAAVLCSGVPAEAPLSAAVATMERRMLAAVETLASVLLQGSAWDAQQDLAHVLCGRGPLRVGLAVARGNNAPLQAADAALAQVRTRSPRLQITDDEAGAVVLTVLSARELSVSEADALKEICRGAFGVSPPRDVLLGSAVHQSLENETVLMLLVRYVSEKVTPLWR